MSSTKSLASSNKPLSAQPSLPRRVASSLIMGLTASLSRVFLYSLNSVEVTGLQRFLDIQDKRKDVEKRQRGLLTGAEDICFKNGLLGAFFSAGQVLPTHRLQHSPHGGLFQPTVPQAVRLLSARPFVKPLPSSGGVGSQGDMLGLPPVYAGDRHSWVHVFPEACVHQHPKMFMRYFKWGVSRMILESEPMPDILPIFIDGTQHMMPEDRGWPRFLPRFGVKFRIAFGELVETEKVFGNLRARWQELVEQEESKTQTPRVLGELSDELKYGRQAVELRIEVAKRVREEVLKVRRSLDYPHEEPPGFELADTWSREPENYRYKSNIDDSLVNKRQ
ncbi:hypothetical protein GQX73_g10703 [Xylaria multiplex]|uniref:Tafazzin family protein n=1 Tax=Xylaria multiplex TaxID=323545 RepID=A0A7C8MJE8_9PEZI|nr:hypothetical protein GQX73_g10703 [Xylaria multiplex]